MQTYPGALAVIVRAQGCEGEAVPVENVVILNVDGGPSVMRSGLIRIIVDRHLRGRIVSRGISRIRCIR